VVPVTRQASGALALGGTGEVVEWLVEMRRFDETTTLDHLAEAGELPEPMIDALAETVAAGHARMPVADASAWLQALARYAADDRETFRTAPDLFPPDEAARLDAATAAALHHNAGLILARGRLGLVRRCHGDLHLANVALVDGRPLPFDAIEFDPLIATGDVLYELAFLLMDLVARGRRRSACRLLNQYLLVAGRDGDLDALAALPLFLSLRAQIRAKVAVARRTVTAGAAAVSAAHDAMRYFRLAVAALAPPPPHLFVVSGLSGTGKTSVARAIAGRLLPLPGALVLRSDIERKRLFEVPATERLPADAYQPEVTARVYRRLVEQARRALEAGHSVVIDAVFARPDERAALAALGVACGVAVRGVWLEAPLDVRQARVSDRRGDASDADAAVAAFQEDLEIGPLDWPRVDAAGPLEGVVLRAMSALGGPW
jgi:aminoglycoside phosphotransferase family enzyme/predicted kinase